MIPPRALSALTALGTLFVTPLAHADQFLLFDVTFTYTWDDAINASPSQSHYYVNDGNVLNTGRPENWLSPIDYRNGTVHIRIEVIDKPAGDQTGYWSLCYIANQGSYGCTNTGEYTAEGVYERDEAMTNWWQNEAIDWAYGVKQMDLVYKKSSGGMDHIHFFPEVKDLLTPTTLRITLVQVSAGDEYDETALGLDFAAGAGGEGGAGGVGGEPAAGADAGAVPEVSGAPNALGGAGGTAGVTQGAGGAGTSATSGTAGTADQSPPLPMADPVGSDAVTSGGAGATSGAMSQSESSGSNCALLQPRSREGLAAPWAMLGLLGLTLAACTRRATANHRRRSTSRTPSSTTSAPPR